MKNFVPLMGCASSRRDHDVQLGDVSLRPIDDAAPKAAPDPDGWAAAKREWDDGEEVIDEDWSITVHCGRCGCRPRPEHNFRCRLHDDMLVNGCDRPVKPEAPLSCGGGSKKAQEREFERYKQRLTDWRRAWAEWTPEWLPEEPHVDEGPGEEDWDRDDDDDYYSLPCVRCREATLRRGSPGAGAMAIQAHLWSLKQATAWLCTTDYAIEQMLGDVPEPVVATTAGEYGRCYSCKLQIGLQAGPIDRLHEQDETWSFRRPHAD